MSWITEWFKKRRIWRSELAKLEERQGMETEKYLTMAYKRLKQKESFRALRRKDVIVWRDAVKKKMVKDIRECEKCGGTTGGLTLDHIIPNFILRNFGIDIEYYHDPRNYRLLCKLCNSLKANQLDFSDPRSKALLLELLQRVEGPDTFEEAHKLVLERRKSGKKLDYPLYSEDGCGKIEKVEEKDL